MSSTPPTALIVPTVREECLKRFLAEWEPFPWHTTIVVEDQPEPTFALPTAIRHYSWREIQCDLAEDHSIISRRSSAIRSYGFWKAWQEGAEIIAALEDDCYPTSPGARDRFLIEHLDNLLRFPRWTSTVPGLRVRGMPYRNLGTLADVAANVGLWENCPDLDAIQSLVSDRCDGFIPHVINRMMASQQYFPLSGMNFAIVRELAPAAFVAPSGEGVAFDRFDDIWFGVIFQNICRRLGKSITCGHPVVRHDRASDPLMNLTKEAPGICAHERVWQILDDLVLTHEDSTVISCVATIPRQRVERAPDANDRIPDYLIRYGNALQRWIRLFEEPARQSTEQS